MSRSPGFAHMSTPSSADLDGADPMGRLDESARRRLTEEGLAAAFGAANPESRRSALHQVVLANLGIARGLAAQHRGKGIAVEDLEQVASVALVAAAERFQPGPDRDFLAFAVPTIRGEIKRHFRDCGWTVRPPRRVQEIHLSVLSTKERLSRDLDRSVSAAEIAAAMDESVQHVAEAMALEGCFAPASLDQPLTSGMGVLGDLLPGEGSSDQEAAEARAMLGQWVRVLGARDRYVVRLRFFEGLTQREIGEELGITQTQVSRIISRILRELRGCLTEQSEQPRGAPSAA